MLKFVIATVLLVAVHAQIRGDVRLVNGSSLYDGTLQVFNADEWRFVCDDNFGLPQSLVVCRQLGYQPPEPERPMCCQAVDPPVYWLDNVRCLGTEQRISECQHAGWGNHNCGPQEGVRVRCTFEDPCRNDTCAPGRICERIDNRQHRCRAPLEPRDPPGYRLTLTGAFDTMDRQAITPECARLYSLYMQVSIGRQLERVNDGIGKTLCNGTQGFSMLQASTSVAPNPNQPSQAFVTSAFILTGSKQTFFSGFYACTNDLSNYLQDHSNWEQPVLPTPPGCSQVAFFAPRFTENGRVWFC